jgi:hypothetical protein
MVKVKRQWGRTINALALTFGWTPVAGDLSAG